MARANPDPITEKIRTEGALADHAREQAIKEATNTVIRWVVYLIPLSCIILYAVIIFHDVMIDNWNDVSVIAKSIAAVVFGYVLAKLKTI